MRKDTAGVMALDEVEAVAEGDSYFSGRETVTRAVVEGMETFEEGGDDGSESCFGSWFEKEC